MDPSTQSETESTIPRLTLSHDTPPTSSSSHSFDNGNTFSVTLTTAPLNLMPDDDNMVDSLDQVLQHGHALIAHLESGLGQIATCQLPDIEATDPFAWSLDDNNLLTCPFREEEGEGEEDHMMSHDPQVVPRNLEIRSEVTRGHALSTIEEGQSEEHSSQSTPDSESEYVHLNTIRTSELERSPSPSPLPQRAAKGAESASTDIDNLQMSNGDTSPCVIESAPLIVNTSSDSTDSHDYDDPPGEETAGAPGNQATNEEEVVASMAEGDGRQGENAPSREREEDEDSEDEYMRLSDVTLGLAQDHQASETASAEGQLGEAEGVARSDPSVREEVDGVGEGDPEGVDGSDAVSPTITVSNGENESLEVRESNHENMEVANGIDINTDASNLDEQESNLDRPVQQEPRALPQESNLDASDLVSMNSTSV